MHLIERSLMGQIVVDAAKAVKVFEDVNFAQVSVLSQATGLHVGLRMNVRRLDFRVLRIVLG